VYKPDPLAVPWGQPVPNVPRSQARASSGPCPASLTALPLEGDTRPSRAEAGRSLRLPRFQDLPKTNTSELIPRCFNFLGSSSGGILALVEIISRSGIRSDCGSIHKLPGTPRGPGFGKTCVSLVCVRPPQGGPIGCSPLTPLYRGRFMCGAGAPWTTAQGGCSTLPPRGVLRDWSGPGPGSCREVVSPQTGGFLHRVVYLRSMACHKFN